MYLSPSRLRAATGRNRLVDVSATLHLEDSSYQFLSSSGTQSASDPRGMAGLSGSPYHEHRNNSRSISLDAISLIFTLAPPSSCSNNFCTEARRCCRNSIHEAPSYEEACQAMFRHTLGKSSHPYGTRLHPRSHYHA